MKYKKNLVLSFKKRLFFLQDISLNLIASFAMTGTLQLIIYPYLVAKIGAVEYGKFLTFIGIINILSTTFGNSLNNVRLMKDAIYKERHIVGDFNIFFLVGIVFITLLFFVCFYLLGNETTISLFISLGVLLLGFFRCYFSVGFRIVLNYKKYLIQCLIYCVAAICSIPLISMTGAWQWPFLFAELGSCIYIGINYKNLLIEPLVLTSLAKKSSFDYLYLISAALINNLLIYLDRLLLYPLMGAENVSVYYTATLFGKTLGIVMTPIAGVLLSYYAKKTRLELKQFLFQCGLAALACFVFYLFSIIVAKPITGFLYPSLIEQAAPFLAIANLGSLMLVLAGIIQPAVLKFCKTSYQPIIQVFHLAAYLLLGIVFLKYFGLRGFCYGALIANSIKVLMLVLVGYQTMKKNNT